MFHDERIPNIGIRVLHSGKEDYMEVDIEINQAGEINLNQLVAIIRQTYQLDSHALFFYLDHSHGAFEYINQEQLINTHFTSLISENNIVFKCEPRLSDQILANPPKQEEETRAKRSRQRIIEEAFLQVEQWRYFYRQGCLNQQGIKMKINLQQSAEIVGVPRKTLEDYFLLLRMGRHLEFDFKSNRKQRIGVLRLYVRQRTKIKNIGSKEIDQKKFFNEMRFELLGQKNEQQIFDILKSSRSHSSSDQDMIFQH